MYSEDVIDLEKGPNLASHNFTKAYFRKNKLAIKIKKETHVTGGKAAVQTH